MLEHDNDERSTKKRFSRRVLLVGGAQAAGFGVLGWRLFQLQVLEKGHYAPLADENRINLQVLPPMRGRILDRGGVTLADSDEIFRATITPALAGDLKAALALFRRIVPLTGEELEKIVLRTKKKSRNAPTVIASGLNFDQVAKINVFAPQLPGIRTEITWHRRYRQGMPVGHLTGYVGSVERTSADADTVMRLPGVRVGKSGIEASFETELRGAGGAQKIEVDARGRTVRNLETLDAKPGRDIALTVDAGLQAKVFARLQSERRASCVAIDITTGEIAVMASTPGYDPTSIADGMTEYAWQRLLLSEDKPLLNRAVSGQYPPGSTFKMVTALAAMRAGLITADAKITCDGQLETADQTYPCWKRSGHGPMTLRDALQASCDVYFFELARRLGIEPIAAMARTCGLGEGYDCGLAEEKTGLVPDPTWKHGRWHTAWLESETILAGVGQGYMLSTPLQLTVMTARIASGRNVVPTLLRRDPKASRVEFAKLGLDEAHLDAVRSGMFAVVNEDGGTGTTVALGEGQPLVAGMMGTSQVSLRTSDNVQDTLEWSARDHSVFVAYVPADAPRYAVSAIIEHGGAEPAAPLVRDVIAMILARDATSTAAATGLGSTGVSVPVVPALVKSDGREG